MYVFFEEERCYVKNTGYIIRNCRAVLYFGIHLIMNVLVEKAHYTCNILLSQGPLQYS